MEQQFFEVDFECLIGKEWSLIGKRLRHETDGLWLKDPSAIDAAQWVDDTGKTQELWVHPTSMPTKPALPFPFTLPQFKTFCDWHPTFEWEAITSVFTNDDDTVDTENLAFVDSRSRAAGALVRYIIGKTDDEFSQAWKQHCAVANVEAKMVELSALKPDKISEIQYRDARLTELRAEQAMLKQGVSDTSAQSPATLAPVETVEQRRTRYLALLEDEEKHGKRGALTRVAVHEGVDRSNMSKDIKKARTARTSNTRAGTMFGPLVQVRDGKRGN
jgi:hypothetical protein